MFLVLLIALLVVALFFSLLIPGEIWDYERDMQAKCHRWLSLGWSVETAYKSRTQAYTDTLTNLRALALDDTAFVSLVATFYGAPVLNAIDDSLDHFRSRVIDSTNIAAVDSIRAIQERLQTRRVTAMMEYRGQVPAVIESLQACPLTALPYRITLQDSAPLLKIACPNPDSTAAFTWHGYQFPEALFRATITPHGEVEDGKFSWEN